MKNKGFKFILVGIALFCSALFFGACGGGAKGSLTFKESKILMAIEQEIDLADYVELTGCNIADVQFKSSDNSIAVVTPRQTVVTTTKEGTVIITAQNYDGYLEIEVKGTSFNFSAPTNVHYDNAEGNIVWDRVTESNIVATQYQINITKNGEPFKQEIVNTNSFAISEIGTFDVEVSCLGRNGVGASELSEKYTFTKLSAPTAIKYNDQTNTLSWEAENNITHFYVKKDGVLSEKITEKTFACELNEATDYSISVISALESDTNVFGTEGQVLTLSRLGTPQVEVKNGQFVWTDTQTGVYGYNVNVYKVDGSSQTLIKTETISKLESQTQTVFDLSDEIYDEPVGYKLQVIAFGDNGENQEFDTTKHYLNSGAVETATVTKLPAPIFKFIKSSGTLEIDKAYHDQFNANSGNNYEVYLNGELLENESAEISQNNGTCQIDFTDTEIVAGEYSLTVKLCTTNGNEINSQLSEAYTIIKLGQIENLQHSIQQIQLSGEDEAYERYVISNISLQNATNFGCEIVGPTGVRQTFDSISANGVVGKVSNLFASVGTYTVSIIASGADALVERLCTYSSATSLSVHKLSVCANLQIDQTDNTFKWQSADYGLTVPFVYSWEIINKTTGTVTQGQTIEQQIEYRVLAAGEYDFKVKAEASQSTQPTTQGLVLSASDWAKTSITFRKQLNSPSLQFGRSESGDGYQLSFEPVDGADTYYVSVNNVAYPTLTKTHTSSDMVVIDVTECFNQPGDEENKLTYVFNVYASSVSNSLYSNSDNSSVNVIKTSAPQKFKLDGQEVISAVDAPSWATTKIWIDGQESNTLSGDAEDVVRIQYISNLDITNGVYYLDSDVSEFKVVRSPITLTNGGMKLTWETSKTGTFVKKVVFRQPSKTDGVEISSSKNEYDLTKYNFEAQGFNLSQPVEISVEYILENLNGNIAGKYENGTFISSGTQVDISAVSNKLYFQLADEALNVEVTENEESENLTINWTAKDGATYDLFQSQNTISGVTTTTLSNALFADVKDYVLTLTEKIESATTIYKFTITRLQSPTGVKVGVDETLVYQLPTGAQKLLVISNNNEIQDLTTITGEAQTVTMRHLAVNDTQSNYCFYLNSATKPHTFTRLEKLSTNGNLTILESKATWSNEEDLPFENYYYDVCFFGMQNGEITQEHHKNITPSQNNNIDFTLPEYQTILNGLTGQKFIKIKKVLNEYTILDAENYLSSAYSNDVEVKIINAPTNVTITANAGDNAQTNVDISWNVDTAGAEVAGYNIKFVYRGAVRQTINLVGANTTYTLDAESGLLQDVGEWKISVQAIGATGYINSAYSAETSVVRLSASAELTMSQLGDITWAQVANAKSYSLTYAYGTSTTATTPFASDVTSTDIFRSQLSNLFAGEIKLTLVAMGDGQTTLSSIKEATVERIAMPQLTFTSKHIVIDNYSTYGNNVKFMILAKIGGREILNQLATVEKDGVLNVIKYGESYRYLDDNSLVDMTVQQTIDFSIYAVDQNQKQIPSNVVEKTVTTTVSATELGFYRDQNSIIHFSAKNNNNVAIANVLIDGQIVEDYNTSDINFEITDLVLKQKFANNWTITVQCLGGIHGEILYLDGNPVSISGTKLGVTAQIEASDGSINWQAVTGASNYVLNVDNTHYLADYTTHTSETLQGERFDGGQHNVAIRAVGNVGSEFVSANIVFDGDYSEPYSVTKLNAVNDFSVTYGFFTFTEQNIDVENHAYTMQVYTINQQNGSLAEMLGEYSLQTYAFPTQDSNTYYYCQELYNHLASYENLGVKIYCKTTQEGYVYSDFANITYAGETAPYIKVARLQNAGAIELYHEQMGGTVENPIYDYTITKAKWEQNPNTENVYLFNINGVTNVVSTNHGYTLDPDKNWGAGVYNISFAQLGSSALTTGRLAYLTADFSIPLTVTKLPSVNIYVTTTVSAPIENMIKFDRVSGANQYTCYVNESYYKTVGINDSNTTFMLKDILQTATEYTFAMRAINTTDVTVLASSMSVLKDINENDEPQDITIKKLPNLSMPKIKDGSLYFELSGISALGDIQNNNGIMSPFFTSGMDGLKNGIEVLYNRDLNDDGSIGGENGSGDGLIEIVFKTTNNPAVTYSYVDTVINFLGEVKPTSFEELVMEAKHWEQLANFNNSLKGGFNSLDYNLHDISSRLQLPAGEYTLSIRQLGLSQQTNAEGALVSNFSSDFISVGTFYVAPAPTIKAVDNSNDGSYNLIFNNVNTNSNYLTASNTEYQLVAVYHDEETDKLKRKVLKTVNANAEAKPNSISLVDLVESGQLNSDVQQIFVQVMGNNSNVLNGKPSGFINIRVLDPVQAHVERGVIKWADQENASGFKIFYTEDGGSAEDLESYIKMPGTTVDNWSWDGQRLTSTRANKTIWYNLSIQAHGSQGFTISEGDSFTLSGTKTNLGQICKLPTVDNDATAVNSISIINGLYVWSHVENATQYDAFVGKNPENLTQQQNVANNIAGQIQYETQVDGDDVYYYCFTAVGTLTGQLGSATQIYLTSNMSKQNQGARVEEITEVNFTNGVISWEPGMITGNYKLTFSATKNGEPEDPIVIFTTETFIDTNSHAKLMNYGTYNVKIQAAWEGKAAVTNTDAYYLISNTTRNTNEVDYTKFDPVENISVKGGIISWNFGNSNGVPNANYKFVLDFSTTIDGTLQTSQIIVEPTDENIKDGKYFYEGVVFENIAISTEDNITLNIYVVAAEQVVENYVKSQTTQMKDISQYESIKPEYIKVKLSQAESTYGNLEISWDEYDDRGSGLTYEIKFEGIEQTYQTDSKTFIADHDFNLGTIEDEGVVISIRVIPKSNNDGTSTTGYISSTWTEKTISSPSRISDLVYNQETYTLTWSWVGSSDNNSYQYKIIDEVTYKDATTGQDITTSYIVYSDIDDTQYQPFHIGTHEISIAVIVRNSDDSAFMSGYETAAVCVFDIFETGNGTEENPYIVADETQFNNMKYRLSKDLKNNYYGIVQVEEDGTEYITKLEDNKKSDIYYFKQESNLIVNIDEHNSVDNTLHATDEVPFNNIYDGDKYALTLNYSHDAGLKNDLNISLFGVLGDLAEIKNVKLFFTFVSDEKGGLEEYNCLSPEAINITDETATITVLSSKNYGKITNIMIGEPESAIKIGTKFKHLNFTFISEYNYGTLRDIYNYYNIDIKYFGDNEQSANIASLVMTNEKTIKGVKNCGNISVYGSGVNTSTNIGGIAVENVGGEIIAAANTSKITAADTICNIGGIVAYVTHKGKTGSLSYCYSTTEFDVYSTRDIGSFVVGGLIGLNETINFEISYSYADITKPASSQTTIYQILGKTTDIKALSVYYKSSEISGAERDFNGVEYYNNIADIIAVEGMSKDNELYTFDETTGSLQWESVFEASWQEVVE
ncbi:MAG: hypothetical protein E7378_00540 [Clostridiales bacterium]|nr:hypothetical protein [Clostridiales bacterium]